MKYLLILLLVSGCATKPTTIEYIPVRTPVPTKVEIPEVERPQLTIDQLTDAQLDSDGELAKAYLTSLLQMISYAEALESIINSIHSQQKEQENGNSTEPLAKE